MTASAATSSGLADDSDRAIWGIWVNDPQSVSGWLGLFVGTTFKPFCWDRQFATERLAQGLARGLPPNSHVATIPEGQRSGWTHGIADGAPMGRLVMGSLE